MNVKNRKCIRRLSWRSLWASRRRNTIAIAAIILTTLLFTSLFTIAMSINASYEMYTFREIGGYCHGTFKEVTEQQIQAIAAHKKVKAVGKRINVGTMERGSFAKVPAEISFMDENCAKWSFAATSTGHMPRNGNEITMDTAALELLGIEPKLGSEISLTYTVGAYTGLEYEKTDTFILAGWWEYDAISPVHYINISEEYANEIEAEATAVGQEPFRRDLNVMMSSELNIRKQMEQVDSDLGYSWDETGDGPLVRIGVNWGYTSSQLGNKVDFSTMAAIITFLVLVIFTGYLIIYNIFQISVTEDIRYYGLLKTIGVTPRQLRRIIGQQALFLCMIGIPIGLLSGYGAGAILTPVVMAQTTYGTAGMTLSASPWIFLFSAVFALVTVMLSCARPGKLAAKVSPVEAAKYTQTGQYRKKQRRAYGAKVYQMAFVNLGREKSKTVLVVISLALSVVLFQLLITFTSGFDTEKYLNNKSCADFIVSSTDYFRSAFHAESYLSKSDIGKLEENTSQSLAGCGYTINSTTVPISWISEEDWKKEAERYYSPEMMDEALSMQKRREDKVSSQVLIEGLDDTLFEKLTVVDGDMTSMLQGETNGIALVVDTDDYGNIVRSDQNPAIGSTITITYIEDIYLIDTRTGERASDNTPEEYVDSYIAKSHDMEYTVCAYVAMPHAMSYRYGILGYDLILPVEKLKADSGKTVIPLFYLFDTPDIAAQEAAESFLEAMTSQGDSGLMYESKATLRKEFESFRKMFLLMGGVLCAIIGIVGILNFVNAIMTGILSRQREFAVLKAVGMTNKQLKSMLVYEGLFYVLSSVLGALLLSTLLNPLLGTVLEKMFWFFSTKQTLVPVLLSIPVFALLGWLIPAMLYRQTERQSIIEQLRDV